MSRDISEHEIRVYQALRESARIGSMVRKAKAVNVDLLMLHQLDQLAALLGIEDPDLIDRDDLLVAVNECMEGAAKMPDLASLDWMTNRDIADVASVAERTARKHTSRLVYLGVIEHDPRYPAHSYRFNPDGLTARAKELVTNLDRAIEAAESRKVPG